MNPSSVLITMWLSLKKNWLYIPYKVEFTLNGSTPFLYAIFSLTKSLEMSFAVHKLLEIASIGDLLSN